MNNEQKQKILEVLDTFRATIICSAAERLKKLDTHYKTETINNMQALLKEVNECMEVLYNG